jgi:hypothetical protein
MFKRKKKDAYDINFDKLIQSPYERKAKEERVKAYAIYWGIGLVILFIVFLWQMMRGS